jgi:hypothetical protein
MTVQANGTSSTGTSTNSTKYSYVASYTTNYASSSTYKVTVTTSEGGQNIVETAWVLKNGTALAVNVSGQNFTGATANEFIVGTFAAFTLQVQADSEIAYYTNTGFFHSTGTSTTNIGSTSVKVTTYAANNAPETITDCNGGTTTLTAYSFSVGTPSGANVPLVTYEHFAGSDTRNGQTESFDYVLQVTAITVA